MTLDEMIALLEEMRDELGGDAEVAVGIQPGYPLRQAVTGVVTSLDVDGDEEEDAAEVDVDAPKVAWIVTDAPDYNVNPYAPRGLWGAAHR